MQFENQEDCASDGQRADEERRNYCCVSARVETEANEQHYEPEHQHDEEGPGKGAAGLFVKQAAGTIHSYCELQSVCLGESLRLDLGRQRGELLIDPLPMTEIRWCER